ncbi:techylectin-5A-like isoform X2 [Macrobrachium rosenbergii]|uniref:techylectin-5A-like isoform X2 n=1 Tax=Macrobrachium rosenbergii TaxID=79674 RepID=UPI0034D52C19
MTRGIHVFLVVSLIAGTFSTLLHKDVQEKAQDHDADTTFGDSESLQEELQRLRNEVQQLQEENQDLLSASSEVNRILAVDEWKTRNGTSLRPTDCTDLLIAGVTESGIYQIYPFVCSCSSPIYVYCDMETDGGGWTVILNRQSQDLRLDSGQLNFNRSWEEYKYGFGSISAEHYLGNEFIHRVTNSRAYTFRMDMFVANGEFKTLVYDNFRVENEESRYKLILGNKMAESSTSYDCYYYSKNKYFSTYDRDHDHSSINCASERGGGYWYHDCRLYYPPTGPYEGHMNNTCYYTTESYRLSNLQIKIRPSLCDTTYKKIVVANNCARGSGSACGSSSDHLPIHVNPGQ